MPGAGADHSRQPLHRLSGRRRLHLHLQAAWKHQHGTTGKWGGQQAKLIGLAEQTACCAPLRHGSKHTAGCAVLALQALPASSSGSTIAAIRPRQLFDDACAADDEGEPPAAVPEAAEAVAAATARRLTTLPTVTPATVPAPPAAPAAELPEAPAAAPAPAPAAAAAAAAAAGGVDDPPRTGTASIPPSPGRLAALGDRRQLQAQLQQLEKQYAELPKSPRRQASQDQVGCWPSAPPCTTAA